MKAKVTIKGVKNLKRSMSRYGRSFGAAEKRAVTKGGKYLQGRIYQEMTRTAGYSGQPYSRKQHPSGIATGLIRPLKDYAIRARSYRLANALSGKLGTESGDTGYFVGMDESKMPTYGLYIFNGTSIMHARDPITGVYSEKSTQRSILKIIEEELKKPQRKNYG